MTTMKEVTIGTDGQAYIQFTGEELAQLGWKKDDELEWSENKDGSWSARVAEKDFVTKIQQFNKIAGTGTSFDARKLALYIGLCCEELAELIEAIPDVAPTSDLGKLRSTLERNSLAFKQARFDNYVARINRVKALDAFVDVAVVALGGGCAMGADVKGAANEVMDSNLSKFPIVNGERVVLKDENGKVMKPATYRPPELAKFLATETREGTN